MNRKPRKWVFVRNGTCTCGYVGGLYVRYITSGKAMRCALCCEQEKFSSAKPLHRASAETATQNTAALPELPAFVAETQR